MQRQNRYAHVLWVLAMLAVPAHAGSIAADIPASSLMLEDPLRRAHVGDAQLSSAARHVLDWVVHSHDNEAMPFMIIDKKAARAFLFDDTGRLLGESPVLLGSAKGDDSSPGVGDRKLADIRAHERTTPAGRFVASLAVNLHGEDMLWVDYATAISLHRVVTSNAKERRAQRLATPTPTDNRISYGCINVPVPFFETMVSPAFKSTNGVVYVLPETKSPAEVFGSYEISSAATMLPD